MKTNLLHFALPALFMVIALPCRTSRAQAEVSFAGALDTDQAGSTIGLFGWTATGDAVVRVQTADTWQGGDALEIRATPEGNSSQSTVISGQFSTGTDFSCHVKRGTHAGCSLTLLINGRDYTSMPLTAKWTEFRVLLPAAEPNDHREIAFRVAVPNDGPDAFVYLDAVSLQTPIDLNAALETSGLTWTSGGNGQQVIDGAFIPASPVYAPDYTGPRGTLVYEGFFDGVAFLGPAIGPSWMETTMTGPGTAVFTGHASAWGAGWTARLQVDGVTKDTHFVDDHSFRLQAAIGAGPHTVRWIVEGSNYSVSPHLHSVALIPGPPEDALVTALAALSPDMNWLHGGSHPPIPLYGLKEGVTSFDGIFFPSLGPGETSWLETTIPGPAQARFTWQSAARLPCLIDGRTAIRAVPEPTAYFFATLPATVELPDGPHTARWEGGSATGELRQFSVTPGSEIAGLLDGNAPPIIWTSQPNAYPWTVATDGPLSGYDNNNEFFEVPGTGLPVLAGADETAGSFRVTGPAVLTYDLRKARNVPVSVYLVSLAPDYEYYATYSPTDLRWHAEAVVIPAGEYRVDFYISEDDSGYEPYTWLRNIRVTPGAAYPDWTASHGLDIKNSSPLFDLDNDGQDSLLEFAFGSDPRGANGFVPPSITGTPSLRQIQFPTLPYDATGLTYEVQISTDLQSWHTVAAVSAHPANQPGPIAPLPLPQSTKEFIRVMVHL